MTEGGSYTAMGASTGNPYLAAAGAVADVASAEANAPAPMMSPDETVLNSPLNVNVGTKDKGLLGELVDNAAPILITVVIGWVAVKIFD